MPELPHIIDKLETRLLKISEEEPTTWSNSFILKMWLLQALHRKEFIGSGAEKAVVKLPGREDKVRGMYFKDLDPSEAKELYYAHKIFSTLFPNNFPNYDAFYGRQDLGARRKTGYVRSVIKKGRAMKHPFNMVEEVTKSYGIFMSDYIDTGAERNFLVGEDGGEYYVDTVSAPTETTDKIRFGLANKLIKDKTKFIKLMDESHFREYSPQDKQTVNKSFDNLERFRR